MADIAIETIDPTGTKLPSESIVRPGTVLRMQNNGQVILIMYAPSALVTISRSPADLENLPLSVGPDLRVFGPFDPAVYGTNPSLSVIMGPVSIRAIQLRESAIYTSGIIRGPQGVPGPAGPGPQDLIYANESDGTTGVLEGRGDFRTLPDPGGGMVYKFLDVYSLWYFTSTSAKGSYTSLLSNSWVVSRGSYLRHGPDEASWVSYTGGNVYWGAWSNTANDLDSYSVGACQYQPAGDDSLHSLEYFPDTRLLRVDAAYDPYDPNYVPGLAGIVISGYAGSP